MAGLACAQLGPSASRPPADTARDARIEVEKLRPAQPAASRIVAVTMYQGQDLVTREVSVAEGKGTVKLVVTPLPPQTVDNSLCTEGADGLCVFSTLFRTRAVKDDTRQEVRAMEELLKKFSTDAQKLQKEGAVHVQDLQCLLKLRGSPGHRSRD